MKKGVLAVIELLAGAAIGAGIVFRQGKVKEKKGEELNQKNDAILRIYNQWMQLRKEGKTVAGYLKENGYQSVAIYGMHYLGESLLDELKDSDIKVEYAIDRNAEKIYADIEVKNPEDSLPEVDVIIVTAFYFIDEIEDMLSKSVDYPVLSIEDIIYDM